LYDSLLDDSQYWLITIVTVKCECVIGGDFNANIDNNDVVASRLNNFIHYCMLTRCDDLFPAQKCKKYGTYRLIIH